MTNEQKLKVNIAAVELLGAGKEWYSIGILNGRVMYKDGINNNDPIYFDLFNKEKGDCLAVVKKLGESDIYLFHTAEGYFVGNEFGENQLYPLYQSKPYEEAVGAACLEIKEIGESNGKI